MGLKSLMQYLQKWVADPPDTSEKSTGYQRTALVHAGCTPDPPDTSALGDACANELFEQFGEAANELTGDESNTLEDLKKPAEPAYRVRDDAWIELDQAYQSHHFTCPTCIAAGRGSNYGWRCTVGLALWVAYQADD